MGEFSWVTSLLTLLFGQVGVLGTIIMAFAAYVGYQLKLEQEAHEKTQAKYDSVMEKRLAIQEATLTTLTNLRASIDAQTEVLKRKRAL